MALAAALAVPAGASAGSPTAQRDQRQKKCKKYEGQRYRDCLKSNYNN